MQFLKKSLGQNFLIDKNVIKKIINSVQIKIKNIIEIGPGKEFTKEILKKDPKSLLIADDSYQKNLKINFSKKKINIVNQMFKI